MTETFAKRPDAGSDEEDRKRNDEPGRKCHQAEDTNSTFVRRAGASKNRECSHVRGEQGKKEYERADCTAREEEGFRILLAASECNAPDVGDDQKVREDDENRNHISEGPP